MHGTIGQDDFFRRTANIFDPDQIEIAEEPVNDKWDRQHHAVIARGDLSRKSVEAVGHQRGAEHDGQKLIKQFQGVAIQNLTMGACYGFEKLDFSTAFAQTDKKRQERGCNKQPGRKALRHDNHQARSHPDDKTRSNDKHID